jgi:hypothetical protein
MWWAAASKAGTATDKQRTGGAFGAMEEGWKHAAPVGADADTHRPEWLLVKAGRGTRWVDAQQSRRG